MTYVLILKQYENEFAATTQRTALGAFSKRKKAEKVLEVVQSWDHGLLYVTFGIVEVPDKPSHEEVAQRVAGLSNIPAAKLLEN